jgi:beta-lactamase regulating signal transducer with metallopeptidase domain
MNAMAWMLTYLLHSTLLLGLAWLVSKPLSRWSVSAEEAVWKVALVGALFTASIQLAAGWQPLGGSWNLAPSSPVAEVGAGLVPTRVGASPTPTTEIRTSSLGVKTLPSAPMPQPAPAPAPVRSWRQLPSVPVLALGAWAFGALLLLSAFGRSYLRLGRRLRRRPRVVGGDLHRQLQALVAEAGLETPVRLTCSSRVPVPVALGLREAEICVPPRALAGLSEEQQEGMLAHELAHIARRDPFWLVLGQAIACVLFFQPLNWVARRRLREISEMLSDEWAVARTGRPLSLAGCLAEVAGWSLGSRWLPVPGMADRPSSLGRRIRRLLDETRSPESPARRAWLAAGMGVLVIVVAAAAPAVSTAREEKPAAKTAEAKARSASAVDVRDATDTPSHPESLAMAEADRHHQDRHHDRDDAEVESDDEDSPDVDVDVKVDADEISEHVNSSIEAALSTLDAQLEHLSADHELTAEEHERLSREIDRSTRNIERDLQPRLEKLSRELAEKMEHQKPTPEMERLAREMAKLAEKMAPSQEELARLQAEIDREVRGLKDKDKLSAEEREQIRERAREMAEKVKPTQEQRREMERLREELDREREKMGERFRAENRDEIERIQREVQVEVERELRGAREELRRTLDERKAIEKQERKDRKEQRKHERDRHDDHHDRDDEDDDSSGR